MDDIAIGRTLRSIRIRVGRRQSDVATRAGLSQQLVSLLEQGGLDRLSLRAARSIAKALGAELVVSVQWRGAELDRLRDEDHALLVARIAAVLEARGWTVIPEVTFSRFGERGSIDLLAFHPGTGTLLVVEAKTEIASVEETLRRLDVKVRLAATIARERFGWKVRATSSMLAVLRMPSSVARVNRHRGVFRRAFPVRGAAANAWIRRPGTPSRVAMLVWLASTSVVGGTRSPATTLRVRRRRRRPNAGARARRQARSRSR